ncbi:hypothetical protein ACHQM5_014426 [Ranunculus cassubicifolius]
MSYVVCPGKLLWPELVGVDGETAAAVIERENPQVKAKILPESTGMVPEDFRCDRVVVWVRDDGIVERVPQVC